MPGVTAVDRVEDALESAHASQRRLNAFTFLDDTLALERAAHIGEHSGPLAGIPVGLKDLIDHQGRVTTCGSAFYRERAATSAPCVSRLETAGAVIIGRTGLHEWAFGFSSENPHFGAVRNPWDLSTSPGGSSGGSGAAVAAGITPIAIGTDTGGSVRVPAALCGTFGLKVTHGRIPTDGVFPLVPSVDTVGPLADSIHNLDLAYRAMAADDSEEPTPRRLTLGVPDPWYDEAPMDPAIGDAFEAALSGLESLGHKVVPVTIEGAIPSSELVYSIAEEVTNVHREFRANGKPYGYDVAERLDDAEEVTDEQKQEAIAWRSMIKAKFGEALQKVDLLVTPTVPIRRKVIGEDLIDGRHYRAFLSYFSALVNQSLHPAIAMPLTDSGAPPASLQAIGPLGSETALIAFGRALEGADIVRFTPAPPNSPTHTDG